MRTKFFFCLTSSLFASNWACAMQPVETTHNHQAPYVIIQGGHGKTNLGVLEGFLEDAFGYMKITDRDGLAGRMGLGKNLNKYSSIELGLSTYPSSTRAFATVGSIYFDNSLYADSKINRIFASDLMFMGNISAFEQRVKLSAGIGVSSLKINYDEMKKPADTHIKQQWEAGSASFIAPKVELRIGSRIKPNLDIYTSVSNIFSVQNDTVSSRDWQPNLSSTSVGVLYYF